MVDSSLGALVTGGAGIIGRQMCKALVENGYRVVAADLKSSPELESMIAKSGGALKFLPFDVTRRESVDDVIQSCVRDVGALNVFCVNAGIAGEDQWRKIVDVNLVGAIHSLQLGIKYMSKKNGGHGGRIILTGSMGSYLPMPESPVYCATKHAILGLVRSYADSVLVKDSGICISMIGPHPIESPLKNKIMKEHANLELISTDGSVVGGAIMELIRRNQNGLAVMLDVDGSLHEEPTSTLDEWIKRNTQKSKGSK